MRVEAFLLCDAATRQQGKLNVLGTFDTIWVKQLPAKHPACTVAMRIRFEKIENGSHSVRIRIVNQGGKTISPELKDDILTELESGQDSVVANLTFVMFDLKFEELGQYKVELFIDGKTRKPLPLIIRSLEEQEK